MNAFTVLVLIAVLAVALRYLFDGVQIAIVFREDEIVISIEKKEE